MSGQRSAIKELNNRALNVVIRKIFRYFIYSSNMYNSNIDLETL